MKKYNICLILFLILTNTINSQYNFSKTFPSPRMNYRSPEAAIATLGLPKDSSLFVSVSRTLDPPNYYTFNFINKLDQNGKIIFSKILGDSIGYFYPFLLDKYNENKFLIAGAKYSLDRKDRNYWFSFYDNNFNEILSFEYPTEFDIPIFVRHLILKNGDIVFAGGNGKLNDRGNGAADKARASVMRVDTLGNVVWYHEFYDTTDEKELHGFSGLAEDEDGNVYISGANGNRDGNGDAIMAKIDRDGKVLWYRQYSSKDAEGFTSLYLQKNGSILAIGFSGSPDIFSTSWLKVYVANLDRNGNINWEKKHSLRYDVGFSNCVAADDGNYVCTGAVQDKEEPDGKDNRDGFLQKLSPNGDVIWEHQYSNWNRRVEFFWNLSKAYDGGYFLGGMSWISEDVHESRSWVVKTDSNGCIVPGCTTDFITEKEPHKELFLLSPNPAQDYVNVYMNDVEFYDRKYDLHLYDQQGRIVQHHVVQGRVTQVDLSSLSAGMYYNRIVDRNNKFMQCGRIVVNR